MQQLEIAHEKLITTDQKVVENTKTTRKKDKRPGKGRAVALSRRIYRLQNSDVYYVESETSDDHYYFVKFKPDVFAYCSCKDNSIRGMKCKHQFAIEFAIKWGTIKNIDKIQSLLIPTSTNNELGQPNLSNDKLGQTNFPDGKLGEANNNNNTKTNQTIKTVAPPSISKSLSSYKDDDYSF
jgi:hypothetical protein